MPSYKILLIDDEPDILEFMQYNLEKEGYLVYTAMNGVDGLKKTQEIHPDVVLIDSMMPKMDGIETCYKIREDKNISNDLIIIFLSARNEEFTQIAAYDAGADDFIAKPIQPRLLNKKLHAIIKKQKKDQKEIKNGISIDLEKYIIKKDGETIFLPKKQFELLNLLYSHPGIVYSREKIINRIWGNDYFISHRNIDVQIRKIREKIGNKHIDTIKGIGYKFVEGSTDE